MRLPKIFLALTLFVTVGCAELALTTPQTWKQKIAYANGALTSVYEGITSCVQSMSCSKDTGRLLVDQADTARAAIDIAGAAPNGETITMCFGKAVPALQCLQGAQTVLNGLSAYLNARK